jgi:hypothetical protein
MRIQDDGARRGKARRSKHTEIMKLIKLSMFSFVPLVPGVQSFEFATSEMPESTFSWSDGFRLKCGYHELKLIIADIITGEGLGCVERMDSAKDCWSDPKFIIGIIERNRKRVGKF